MSDAVEVDIGALGEFVDDLARWAARAEALAADLAAEMRRLHGQWTGRAADEHAAAHERWRTAEGELRAAAERVRRVVALAGDNYAAAVSANGAMWRGQPVG